MKKNIKSKYVKGDKLKLIECKFDISNYHKKGDIIVCDGFDDTGDYIRVEMRNGTYVYTLPKTVVPYHNEEFKKVKIFCVGDVVEIIADNTQHGYPIGTVCVVSKILGKKAYALATEGRRSKNAFNSDLKKH